MRVNSCCAARFKNAFGLADRSGRPLRNHQEFGSLDGFLIVKDTIFRDANTKQAGAERADATNYRSILQRANDPTDEWAKHHDVSDTGDQKHGRSE